MKQSPRFWYKQLSDFFKSIHFLPSKVDPCFFISSDAAWKYVVFIHVNNLLIICHQTESLKKLISKRFTMEDMGDCTFFLGMCIVRDRDARTLTLYQKKYINLILYEYGMRDC